MRIINGVSRRHAELGALLRRLGGASWRKARRLGGGGTQTWGRFPRRLGGAYQRDDSSDSGIGIAAYKKTYNYPIKKFLLLTYIYIIEAFLIFEWTDLRTAVHASEQPATRRQETAI